MIVDTVAVPVEGAAGAAYVLQNLGPDVLYIGNSRTVTPFDGISISAGGDFTSPTEYTAPIWLVTTGECDVRILLLG
jgi:hypothetical protein